MLVKQQYWFPSRETSHAPKGAWKDHYINTKCHGSPCKKTIFKTIYPLLGKHQLPAACSIIFHFIYIYYILLFLKYSISCLQSVRHLFVSLLMITTCMVQIDILFILDASSLIINQLVNYQYNDVNDEAYFYYRDFLPSRTLLRVLVPYTYWQWRMRRMWSLFSRGSVSDLFQSSHSLPQSSYSTWAR